MLGIRRFGYTAIDLFQGDITEFVCDAMVNAANAQLAGGGGVDGAIHRAGGPSIMAVCRAIGGCPTGSAVVTTAGELPADWVIHAVGPIWEGGSAGEAEALVSAYAASLRMADDKKVRHLALPSLSTGAYRYPLADAAKIAMRTVKTFLTDHSQTSLERITFVLFNEEHYRTFQMQLFTTFPEV